MTGKHVSDMSIVDLNALGKVIEDKYDNAKRRNRVLVERVDSYARQSDECRKIVEQAKRPEGESPIHYVDPVKVDNTREVLREMMDTAAEMERLKKKGESLNSLLNAYINQL